MPVPAFTPLERVYYWIVAPATVALVFLVFPLRGYDERAHLYRAEALAHGVVAPAVVRSDTGAPAAGGSVDRTLRGWSLRFPLWSAPIEPVSRSRFWSTVFVHSDDARIDVPYSNTAIYPPFLYLESAAAILLAKAANTPVAIWFYAARLANALTAIAIIGSLMRTMPAWRPVILVFAALPIVFFQSATVSVDGVMLPVALAFACLLARMFAAGTDRRATTVALAVATVLLCVGKIAYIPFVVLPPLAARAADGRWSPRARVLAAVSVASLALWAGWSWIIHDKVFTVRALISIDPVAQLRWIVAHPVAALEVLGRTAVADASSIVTDAIGGHVGALQIWNPIIVLGVPVLLAAALRSSTSSVPRWFAAVVATVAVGIGVGIFLLLYLQFNAVASEVVTGIQGRYFVPSAMMLIVFCPFRAGARHAALFDRLAIAFAITSVGATVFAAASTYWVA